MPSACHLKHRTAPLGEEPPPSPDGKGSLCAHIGMTGPVVCRYTRVHPGSPTLGAHIRIPRHNKTCCSAAFHVDGRLDAITRHPRYVGGDVPVRTSLSYRWRPVACIATYSCYSWASPYEAQACTLVLHWFLARCCPGLTMLWATGPASDE